MEDSDERADAQITVVIADDHAVVREGLRLILDAQAGLKVVAEADGAAAAIGLLRQHRPDVLLLDIHLGSESGLAALPRLRAAAPATAIVILTMQSEPQHARLALDAGASGYVLKESAGHDLVRAIRGVAAGGTYVDAEISGALIRGRVSREDDPLTRRERQVLELIALGHTNAEIGETLHISVRTAESHRARLLEKLDASGRAQLIRRARERGLIG